MKSSSPDLRILIAFISASLAYPATLTVCASGCKHRSVQAAIDQARPGDIVELKAGERFVESVIIGAGKARLTLQSSRSAELPAAGYRIRPDEHAPLLATIVAPATDPALRIGSEQNAVQQNGIDLGSGQIRFDYAPAQSTLRNGAAVACYIRGEFLGRLPTPLLPGRQYWVRDWSAGSRTGRLAETADGPAIRLTDTGSAGQAYFYARPACTLWDQPRDISVTGIRFEAGLGKSTRNLVQVGHNAEADPLRMGPARIRFRHTVITGMPDDPTGPLICLGLFGGYQLAIADSWIGHCKKFGEESKGIGIQNVAGARITNNYIAAASINLLTGGGDAARGEVNQDLIITGNFLEKPGYMMYKEGPGEPTGSCYYGGGSGVFYRRTDVAAASCAQGACYSCSSNNAWVRDGQAPYRNQNYLTKNLLEIKDCEHCLIQGNMMRGSFAGPDSGQGWCFGVSVGVSKPGVSGFGSGYHRVHHVAFRDNLADACYSGIVVVNSAYEASFQQIPILDLVVENNLLTNFGWFPAMSQFPQANTVNRYGLKQSGGNQQVRIANNTIRGRPEGSYTGAVFYSGNYQPTHLVDYHFTGNIFHYRDYALLVDSRMGDCSPAGLMDLVKPSRGGKNFRNNIFYAGVLPSSLLETPSCQSTLAGKNFTLADDGAVGFVSATDSRLRATSHYSAANRKAKALSDDGTDVGADVDLIEQSALPALHGTPPPQTQIGLEVRTGSRQAVLQYQRPEGVASCQVTLYSGPRMESAVLDDTRSAQQQDDGRSSSAVQGPRVQFLAGGGQPLRPGQAYSYRIGCGATSVIGRFGTRAAASGPSSLKRQFESATAAKVRIEYATTPAFAHPSAGPPVDFSGGQALVNQTLPGSFCYWRPLLLGTGGETLSTGPVEIWVAQ